MTKGVRMIIPRGDFDRRRIAIVERGREIYKRDADAIGYLGKLDNKRMRGTRARRLGQPEG